MVIHDCYGQITVKIEQKTWNTFHELRLYLQFVEDEFQK